MDGEVGHGTARSRHRSTVAQSINSSRRALRAKTSEDRKSVGVEVAPVEDAWCVTHPGKSATASAWPPQPNTATVSGRSGSASNVWRFSTNRTCGGDDQGRQLAVRRCEQTWKALAEFWIDDRDCASRSRSRSPRCSGTPRGLQNDVTRTRWAPSHLVSTPGIGGCRINNPDAGF